MKNCWKELLLSVMLAWVVPWVVIAAAEVKLSEPRETQPVHTQSEQPEKPPEQSVQTIELWKDGALEHIPMDTYLTGVLLSEMPGSFHMEAKKAQAVVARTYALRRMGGSGKHPGAVCADSSCCQGYSDPETFSDRGAAALARQAVEATADMVLTYDNELIDATYFSCSGGMTEDAVAVWGSDVPYLQSVESPGEEIAAHYTDTVFIEKTKLESALGIKLSGENYVSAVTYTEGGGVASVTIGGHTYRGTELRSILGLRSTAFEMRVTAEGITFTTKGYGHRVGMSQYGAQAMALRGSTYEQILAHYYQGTVLTDWIDK